MPKPMGRLRAFFAELKRRHVVRVASYYIVGAWVAVQVATTVTPILDLPDWLPRAVVIAALLGFPAALILAWAFDITPEGVERTDALMAGDVSHETAVRAPWLRPAVGVLAILVLFGGAYTVWVRLTHHAADDEATAIAVLPFTVHGGPQLAYLRGGMVNLLSTKLNGAGSLRAIDPTALLKTLDTGSDAE